MSFTNLNNRITPAAGNGVTTAFPVTFPFTDQDDLKVYVRVDATGVETLKTITTHYTVSGGAGSTGTVTFLTAPATGETVVIFRDPPLTQEVDLVENDPAPAETMEGALDKLTQMCQRLDERMDRAVGLSEAYSDAFDPTLPTLLEAGACLIVNEDGDGFEMGPTADEVSDAQANATAAAASAAAAATSETNAAASEAAAATSETNAAASAAAAAGYAAGNWPYAHKAADYTALITDRVVEGDPTGGAFTVTLPTAVGNTGLVYVVKHDPANVGANVLNVGTTSAQTIDGAAAPYVLAEAGAFVMLISDGANWKVISAG